MSQVSRSATIFIGINLGIDKVTAAAVTDTGELIASSFSPYNTADDPGLIKGRHEQRPEIWWDATRLSIGQLINQLRTKGVVPPQVKAISVCGVPGPIAIMDRGGKVLHPAIMGDDSRAMDQITGLNFHGQMHCKKVGIQFTPSHAIAKIAWVKDNLPEIYENAFFVHQTDYIVGMLKGIPDVTEYSTAMRTGCDLLDECWPDWLDYDMHLGVRDRLPQLVPLGTFVGKVTQKASASTGLPSGLPIIMGSTTETAIFAASGARRSGDFSMILEDNMSISGMTRKMLAYSHSLLRMYKLPARQWFFTTESNTGAEWIHVWFNESEIPALEAKSQQLIPSDYLAYPNVRKGEVFPFNSNGAEGFISPATDNHPVQFASCLQGTALLERLCYQMLDKMADHTSSLGDIYSGGKWCKNDIWMQCRADVTGRINHRLSSASEPAFGAAMIAGVGAHFQTLEAACDAMLHIDCSFMPNPAHMMTYQDRFNSFSALLEEQGYISSVNQRS